MEYSRDKIYKDMEIYEKKIEFKNILIKIKEENSLKCEIGNVIDSNDGDVLGVLVSNTNAATDEVIAISLLKYYQYVNKQKWDEDTKFVVSCRDFDISASLNNYIDYLVKGFV